MSKAVVIRGDAARLPLPDASVDLIVTSPPYFGLRSYTDGGEHYDGQIGSEATPRAYLDALWACTAEWMRVLKPEGSLFVNIGDKYSTYEAPRTKPRPEGTLSAKMVSASQDAIRATKSAPTVYGIPYKSLMGMPWRYALGCTDDLGLILRAEIIWAKPNGLPESVTDRVRRSHEQMFHFTRQPRYYSAVDEVRETYENTKPRGISPHQWANHPNSGGHAGLSSNDKNPLGKLPGSVWEIPSAPLTVPARLGVDHFAAYPPELVRRIVLGWSPAAVCTACGQGRRPMTSVATIEDRKGRQQRIIDYSLDAAHGPDGRGGERWKQTVRITGYACACPDATAPATPGTVLDPFGGTGTTALVASVHGRTGISVDRSADYCRLAQWRVSDPGERARALGVPKPPPVINGQMDLFSMAE